MKRFTKFALGCAITCATVGLGLAVAGLAMGAASTGKEVLAEALDNTINSDNIRWSVSVLKKEDWDDQDEDWSNSASPKTESGLGAFVYEFESLKNLDVELSSDEFYLKKHDGTGVRVETNGDTDKIRVKQDGDTLKIKSLTKLNGTKITLYYPENLSFNEMDIEVDAGTIHMEDALTVNDLEIQVGAGEMISNDTISAREVSIDVGAGDVEISKLDAGSLEAECGVGALNIGLVGNESEYNYKVECGLGSVTVGDDKYSGISESAKVNNAGATRSMELECGLGDVAVVFNR